MWTRQRILQDLVELRVGAGDALLVHASMRAVGTVDGGADTVLEALLEAVGQEGTVMAPCFRPANRLSADGDAERPLDEVGPFQEEPDARFIGVLAERLRLHPDACMSDHPSLPFAAVGKNAAFLTGSAPLHYPLGTNSPLARLHQLDGRILLIGVDHTVNSSIHLAEVWSNVPYARRKARVRTGAAAWRDLEGSPECSAGFAKIEPILRQARILKCGLIGSAESQSMRAQFVVSMAIEMLKARPDCLLCDSPHCEHCTIARKMTRAQDTPDTVAR